MYCKNCGREIPIDAKLCPYCGINIDYVSELKTEKIYYVSSKNRMFAMILCAFGFIGIGGLHRIYVQKNISGILYLFTFGVLGIGTIYDLCKLYYESFNDNDGYPLYSNDSMRQNYKRRSPKPAAISIRVLSVICVFLVMSGFVSTLSSINSKKENITQTQDNSQKDETEILKQVEEIKEDYKSGNFSDAQNILDKLKKNYPNTKYISIIENDYPDLKTKAEAAKKMKKEQEEKNLGSFNSQMSNSGVAPLYEGYEINNGYITVYVNGYWDKLIEDQKYGFINFVLLAAAQNNLKYQYIKIKKIASKKTVATWNSTWGISIKD